MVTEMKWKPIPILEGYQPRPRLNRDDLLRIDDSIGPSGQPVRFLTLNNPKSANSLREILMLELTTAILRAQESIIVLRSAGSNFCGGLDLWELKDAVEEDDSPARMLRPLVHLFETLARHPRPTVSLVRGKAAAGGVGLACSVDVVVAHEDAELIIPNDETYFELAKVFIPILDERRKPTEEQIESWFAKEPIDVERAMQLKLIDAKTSSRDDVKMWESAVRALRASNFLDPQRKYRTRLPWNRRQQVYLALSKVEEKEFQAQLKPRLEKSLKGKIRAAYLQRQLIA